MNRWWRVTSLVGICCSSLCVVGLPLLSVWLPATFLGWVHNDRLARAMLVMFLVMALGGAASSFRHHHNRGPAALAVAGALALAAATWRTAPAVVAWLALAALISGGIWDWRLMRNVHHARVEPPA